MRFIWEVENRTYFSSFAKARAEALKWVTDYYSSAFEEYYQYLRRVNYCGIGRRIEEFVKGYLAAPHDLSKRDFDRLVEGLTAEEKKKVRKKIKIDPEGGTLWIKLGPTYDLYTDFGKESRDGQGEYYLALVHGEWEECGPDAEVTIRRQLDWGSSAYPLLVLNVLSDKPQTLAMIVKGILEKYHASIERKAVGRHVELLKMLGYNVRYQDGYYIDPAQPRVEEPYKRYSIYGYVPPDPLTQGLYYEKEEDFGFENEVESDEEEGD